MGNSQKGAEKLPTRTRTRKPRRSVYENADLKEGILTEINQIRELHQVPELISSGDIDSIAQAFANKLAKTGELDYSNNSYKGGELGEILFYNEIGEIDTESVIDTWHKDSKDFRYNNSNYNPEATPFAQLVWKSTKLIGVGFSKDEKGGTFIVANFFPTGNVANQYSFNVFPPKGDLNQIRKKKRQEFSKFALEALEAHNRYRTKHHSPPLTLNKELCKMPCIFLKVFFKIMIFYFIIPIICSHFSSSLRALTHKYIFSHIISFKFSKTIFNCIILQ